MNELYIGVMSGTSLDGIDITLCEIDKSTCRFLDAKEYPYPQELKDEILEIISGTTTIEQIGELNSKLGFVFANAINNFLDTISYKSLQITAIGLHGQTLWHAPHSKYPFSMQLGCPNIISAKTDIQVITDFRNMDIANGGEGAPFAPAFHQFLFGSMKNTAVLNIGGMANITILGDNLRGWDTGVGNALMDYWINECKNKPYDKNGEFAASGEINKELLRSFLEDEYFKKNPPKSTGREYFNPTWLSNHLPIFQSIKDEDIQRTLLELTAQTIIDDVKKTDTNLLIVCGGGVKNSFLMKRLQKLGDDIEIKSSDDFDVSSEFMEAMAFAWLAYKRVHRQKVELKLVTGAKKDSILGGIYG